MHTAVQLFSRTLGQGQPLVIMHGLFGSSDNWLSVARKLAEHYQIWLLDMRNHGQSPRSNDFSYGAMVEDLLAFLNSQNLAAPTIMGHSMGGKAAMNFALQYPERCSRLVIVDIAPRAYPVHHQAILDGLNSMNLATLGSRKEADDLLAQYEPGAGVRQFLLKNLDRDAEGRFVWKLNLPVITQQIANVGTPLSGEASFTKPTLFIAGAQSHYIQPSDAAEMAQYFPNYDLEVIQQASHWVHAEQPDAFTEAFNRFMAR